MENAPIEIFEVDANFGLAPSVVGQIRFGQRLKVAERPPQPGEIALAVHLETTECVLYRPNLDVAPFETRSKSGKQVRLENFSGWIIHGTVVY